jgi:hypothetical protein
MRTVFELLLFETQETISHFLFVADLNANKMIHES